MKSILSRHLWRRSLRLGALGLLPLASLEASVLLQFDGLPSGTPANVFAPANSRFDHALFDFDYDADTGDPIPGTERWRPDPLAPTVVVGNPADYGRGLAPSPNHALDALWQPVLLSFNQPINLVSFAVTLDNDPFGVDGTQPGFEDVAVVFLDAQGFPLAAIRLNQTQPGFQASRGPLDGVAGLVLPAGAFYDDLSWAPVPEPGSWALVAGMGVLGFGLCRRLTSRGGR